ncbi:hypothetical protein DAPPUDRAFT_63673 [Daphnia pulex]|uniref:Alpha 1,4-glycosyltransferase domain-containing protein n=1 Tax=Daphnia pulex TaxID=6669 RepID=E9HK42_DAPPU|nr:hypothetical protein DAPPUDRAFT_63673 [Daphnia pulex]|eukprot:EFX67897.1 hypothetical protein DAPPUDRAFT_63673 [Daphnia pulex]
MHGGAFFIETSGSATLNFRQACAVESLAHHNPNLTVNVLFMGGRINTSLVTLKMLKEKYDNIHLFSFNLDDYMAGTPLQYWYHCNGWRDGPFHVSHLSDGLRFLTLHKYGGYYFDLDVISVRPVTDLRNFVAAESDDYLGSGVLHAEFKNPVMELAVKDFAANYRQVEPIEIIFPPKYLNLNFWRRSDVWGHNGPALLLRVLKSWCKAKDLLEMDYVSCHGFNVLHYSSFCPVDYSVATKEFFIHRPANQSRPFWLTDQVVGIHTWNKLTYNKPIYKNSTQRYTWLARNHCPSIFSIAPEIF